MSQIEPKNPSLPATVMSLPAVSLGVDLVTAALVAAQAEFPLIDRTRVAKMGNYSYTYADLSDIFKAVKPILAKHKLAVTQTVDFDGFLVTYIRHSSGQFIASSVPLCGTKDTTAQAMGSALTYSRRYCACLALGIVTEEDDDGAGAMPPAKQQPAQRPAAQAARAPAAATTRPTGAPPTVGNGLKFITEPQLKRLFAIAGKAGWTADDLDAVLDDKGVKSKKEIPHTMYDGLCKYIEAHPAPADDQVPF